jgi:MFS family permease
VIDEPARRPGQRPSFLWLYALAWAGGAVAYVPFLTILLPVRLAVLAGDSKVEWLAYITFFGALAASIGGIVFGWLSDRSKSRRPWIAAGLASSIALLLCVPMATSPLQLLLIIIAWQLALNMMLGPLAAWAADHIPRHQLGTLGGMLAFSPALGSIAGAVVTVPGLSDANGRLAIVAMLVVACVAPALIFASPLPRTISNDRPAEGSEKSILRNLAIAMWTARFLVQISEAALFAYLYYYFRAIDPDSGEASIARLFGIVLTLAVPVALFVGRWADRRKHPIIPLIGMATASAVGLTGMAFAATPIEATSAYVLFGLATTVFLSLHSAQTLRVLSAPDRRGRDLGIFNLTNTAPSLVMPWLTIAMVPAFGFSALFLALATLALAAAAILLAVTWHRFRA